MDPSPAIPTIGFIDSVIFVCDGVGLSCMTVVF